MWSFRIIILTVARPNFDSLQALLMTSFVLLNDMKAEGSWALLGLTCRLAQSLGLHRPQMLEGRESPDVMKREMVRRKLWYTHSLNRHGRLSPANHKTSQVDLCLA